MRKDVTRFFTTILIGMIFFGIMVIVFIMEVVLILYGDGVMIVVMVVLMIVMLVFIEIVSKSVAV